MKLLWIGLLAGSKRKKEDTFGLNDEDWDLYKQIVSSAWCWWHCSIQFSARLKILFSSQ